MRNEYVKKVDEYIEKLKENIEFICGKYNISTYIVSCDGGYKVEMDRNEFGRLMYFWGVEGLDFFLDNVKIETGSYSNSIRLVITRYAF